MYDISNSNNNDNDNDSNNNIIMLFKHTCDGYHQAKSIIFFFQILRTEQNGFHGALGAQPLLKTLHTIASILHACTYCNNNVSININRYKRPAAGAVAVAENQKYRLLEGEGRTVQCNVPKFCWKRKGVHYRVFFSSPTVPNPLFSSILFFFFSFIIYFVFFNLSDFSILCKEYWECAVAMRIEPVSTPLGKNGPSFVLDLI